MPSTPAQPKAAVRSPQPGHLATADLRGAQVPEVGQLWRTPDGSVWRVIDVDLTRPDPYERVVLEVHESSHERDMGILGVLENERQPQLAYGRWAYPPLTASSFDRMSVEPAWFEQTCRSLVKGAA